MVYTHWCWFFEMVFWDVFLRCFFEMVFWDGLWFYRFTTLLGKEKTVYVWWTPNKQHKKKWGGAICRLRARRESSKAFSWKMREIILDHLPESSISKPQSLEPFLSRSMQNMFGPASSCSQLPAPFLSVFQVLKRIPGSGKKPCRSFLRVVQPVALCIPKWPAVAILGKLISGFDARL